MFLLVAGRAQSRGHADEPIRTQRDRSRSRDSQQASHRTQRRVKESDSSNNYPVIVGPLTTNQDLSSVRGEKIYNLPLMIQQPFLREKKEPIKVDISVKLIPKTRKKERKRREVQVEELVSPNRNKGVKNCISMEVTDNNVNIINESVEVIENTDKESTSKNNNMGQESVKEERIEKDTDDVEHLVLDDIVSTEEISDELHEEKINEAIASENNNVNDLKDETVSSEVVNLTTETAEVNLDTVEYDK